MLGELDAGQIDEVLRAEVLGRIGCVANGWPYVVPVNYVYDGDFIYGHSAEGLKLRAMRDDPLVCFEVEQIRTMTCWRTVLLRGHFEQLWNDAEEAALQLLARRFARLDASASARLSEQERLHRREHVGRPILFRIGIEDRTGRFELT